MITLRKLQEKDTDGMYEWLQDEEIVQQFQFGKCSKEDALRFINSSQVIDSALHLAVVDNMNDEYLGTVSLKNIDHIDHNAEYAICIRKCAMGKNIAKQATQKVLQIGFYNLQLNRIYLNVLSSNVRAIKFYQKFGFIYEGTFKQHKFNGESYSDLLWYRLLKEEFENM